MSHQHNTSKPCPGLSPVMEILTEYQCYILFAFEITITTFILLTNILVILSIIKTKKQRHQQKQRRTTNLVFLLSVTDILVALFSQTCKLKYFYQKEDVGDTHHDCSFYILIFFVVNYFPLFSFYVTFIIIYNNYAKLKFKSKYLEQMDGLKVVSHILYLGVLALLQSVTLGIAVAINLHFVTSLITPFEFIGFVVASVLQYQSYNMLKVIEASGNQSDLPYANRNIYRMSTIYLIANALTKSPVFFSELSIFVTEQTTNERAVAVMLGYALANCTSISNAITFMAMDEEACKACKQFIQNHCCQNYGRRVSPEKRRKMSRLQREDSKQKNMFNSSIL